MCTSIRHSIKVDFVIKTREEIFAPPIILENWLMISSPAYHVILLFSSSAMITRVLLTGLRGYCGAHVPYKIIIIQNILSDKWNVPMVTWELKTINSKKGIWSLNLTFYLRFNLVIGGETREKLHFMQYSRFI